MMRLVESDRPGTVTLPAAEAADLRAKAARWDWVRPLVAGESGPIASNREEVIGLALMQGRDLDAAIDAAIQDAAGGAGVMSGHCLICGTPVAAYEPEYCCSGDMCNCFGQPTNPCLCSGRCETALFDIRGTLEERRIRHGIVRWVAPRPPNACDFTDSQWEEFER